MEVRWSWSYRGNQPLMSFITDVYIMLKFAQGKIRCVVGVLYNSSILFFIIKSRIKSIHDNRIVKLRRGQSANQCLSGYCNLTKKVSFELHGDNDKWKCLKKTGLMFCYIPFFSSFDKVMIHTYKELKAVTK